MRAPTERFSDRVENYVKYRPSYPEAVLEGLRAHCGLSHESVVADVGSGTGIFTALLLQSGCHVYAVEPNAEMRNAAEKGLSTSGHFHSVSGTAEHTGLDAGSVDIITAAQAFHWFAHAEARREFRRVLKPAGWIALVWNQRMTDGPFERAYEEMLREHVPEYDRVNHRKIDLNDITAFLDPAQCQHLTFPNCQDFDLEGLVGRMLSSSYTPVPGAPRYAELMAAAGAAFGEHARDGRVAFGYETHVYLGSPGSGD